MGNCIHKSKPRFVKAKKQSKNVQIVEMDGKIMELKTPITVEKFLVKFSGFSLAMVPKSCQYLHLSYELEKGNTYYLVPVPKTEEKQNVKRIKVVITKQQLQELLAKKISFEDVVLGVGVESFCSVNDDHSRPTYSKNKTKLEPIPEDIE